MTMKLIMQSRNRSNTLTIAKMLGWTTSYSRVITVVVMHLDLYQNAACSVPTSVLLRQGFGFSLAIFCPKGQGKVKQ